jgi:hypothetical protein
MQIKSPLVIFLAFGLALFGFQFGFAADAPHFAPNTPHCVRSGPAILPIDYCGCTWGGVYYRKQLVRNATVTLNFGALDVSGPMTSTVTAEGSQPPYLYYDLSGHSLGALLYDILTVRVPFANQKIARDFMARPDNAGEQEVPLVLPILGEWVTRWTDGYTQTLGHVGGDLWAGGPAGLRSLNLTSGISQTHDLPWNDPAVIALGVTLRGGVWAAGPHHLAEYADGVWHNRSVPFTATIRALMLHPQTNAVWLAGGDTSSALAVWSNDAWTPINLTNAPLTTLAADRYGDVWVGTWGRGLYSHAQENSDLTTGWTQHSEGDGLASKYVLSLATQGDLLWVGSAPYNGGTVQPKGGVSRYLLTEGEWERYTTVHGLPADSEEAGAPAPIYALAATPNGLVWAGTPHSVHLLVTPGAWITDTVTSSAVRSLTPLGAQTLAGQANGHLLWLDQEMTPGNPPAAHFTTANHPPIGPTETITLTASAHDQDGSTPAPGEILGWAWYNLDGRPLCTTGQQCVLPGDLLGEGVHTIRLRVQDDEGVWSPPVFTNVTVERTRRSIYLPVVIR